MLRLNSVFTQIGILGVLSQVHGATLGFDIILDYTNPPSVSEAAAFSAAEATWESVITGYLDTVSDNELTITVNIEPIDGVNGVLGSAGPTTVKTTPNYVYANAGSMTFDSADTAGLEANGTFDDVILHEMGHVIGVGTLWSSSGVGIPGRQELYVDGSGQYTGAAGVAAYNAEFAQNGAFVPVELAGGPGTADGHWNEVDNGAGLTGIVSLITGQDLRDELMTGWLNAPLFMSNLTIASMQDMGYATTDLAQVPEPSTILIAGMGLALGFRRRRV